MKHFFSSKKLLLLALLEDTLVIFFVLTLLVSVLEVILPGILANKLPLAFLFTALALLIFLYGHHIKKEGLSYPQFRIPLSLSVILFVGLLLVTLFMNRAFGLWGSVVQFGLLLLVIFTYWRSRE